MSATIEARNAFLADLAERRGRPSPGGNPHNFLELYGARMVEVLPGAPDPATYRGEYYYNSTANRLYRRVVTSRGADGVVAAQWVGAGA